MEIVLSTPADDSLLAPFVLLDQWYRLATFSPRSAQNSSAVSPLERHSLIRFAQVSAFAMRGYMPQQPLARETRLVQRIR